MTSAARISSGSLASEAWKAARRALEARLNAGRQADLLFRLLDRLAPPRPATTPGARLNDSVTDRELALVVDGERRSWPCSKCVKALERHLHARWSSARRCSSSDSGILLELRLDLQDHVVLVQLREDGRDLALAEGVVERVVDGICGVMPSRERVSRSMTSVGFEPAVLLVAGHVAQLRKRLRSLVHEPRRPGRQLLRVGVLQAEY